MPASPASFVAQTEGEITPAAAATAKTFLSVISASNKGFIATEIGVAFIGTVAAAKPVLVELCTSTQAGAGSGSSAVTPRPVNPNNDITVTSSAAKGYTSEPTVLVPIREWLVHPQAPLICQFPLGREPKAVNGYALAVRITFASAETTVNGRVYMEFEE
jgi:hypothetical protein